MKRYCDFVVQAILSGVLVVVPVYLAALLVVKILQSLAGLVQPIAGCFRIGYPPGGTSSRCCWG
jgi:hypothetical protein